MKEECVDQETARHLGYGSVSLARTIADNCLAEALREFHPGTTLGDVQRAEREAPNGVIADLIGKVPGVGDAGDYGFYTLRALKNFDCRASHPGGTETVCNAPIDRAYIEEDWPYWRDNFGKSRVEYDKMVLQDLLEDEERRQRLRKLRPSGSSP